MKYIKLFRRENVFADRGDDNELHLFEADEIQKSNRICSKIKKGYELLETFLPEAKVIKMPEERIYIDPQTGRYYNLETSANEEVMYLVSRVCAIATYGGPSSQLPIA